MILKVLLYVAGSEKILKMYKKYSSFHEFWRNGADFSQKQKEFSHQWFIVQNDKFWKFKIRNAIVKQIFVLENVAKCAYSLVG